MPAPRSPLDKTSSSHSRRPSAPRRSSSDKSTKSSKHGTKAGPPSQTKTKDLMSETIPGATAVLTHELASRREGQDALPSVMSAPQLPHRTERLGSDPRSNPDDQGRSDQEPRTLAAKGLASRDNSAEELERLRAQMLLNQHQERPTRQLGERRGDQASTPSASMGRKAKAKAGVSPINEETVPSSPSFDGAFTSPMPSVLATASSGSAKTVRGGFTPAATIPTTPSYPFPSMRPPTQTGGGGHRPFTALSPTVNPSNYAGGTFDTGLHHQLASGTATPASKLNFQPSGAFDGQRDPEFETPNLYELSLMLAAEPGLDAWWTTVVQLMRDLYKAERVSLSVPADSTDVENVPWGQKATFNALEEDEFSLAYLQRGSSLLPSSGDTNETSTSEETNFSEAQIFALPIHGRPGMPSRHSFTAYEDSKRDLVSTSESSRVAVSRPSPVTRAKSYFTTRTDAPLRTAALHSAEFGLQALEEHMAYKDSNTQSGSWEDAEGSSRQIQGRIFSVLQALDYEADPLLDSGGVLRVLERGKVIALTRDYPYLEEPRDEKSGGSSKSTSGTKRDTQDRSQKGRSPEMSSRISNFLGNPRRPSRGVRTQSSDRGKSLPASGSKRVDDGDTQSSTPRYEEYEQAPPSPWAQSPAPSPAIRAETAENPFFASMPVNEEAFNPNVASPSDYSQMPPVEAIGIDRSWTVLHIPLVHPLLSKPVQSFRLDAAAMEMKSAGRGKGADPLLKQSTSRVIPTPDKSAADKRTPIAILSILTPVIPYPSHLTNSLAHLSPHLATSFSLCRHYSNLETEIAGLSRKRPQITGFGAVVASGHPKERATTGSIVYSPVERNVTQISTGGSITSPSDYSGISINAGSPAFTPSWGPGSIGFSHDQRSTAGSPIHNSTREGYFTSKTRPKMRRVDTGSAASITSARKASKETSPVDRRSSQEEGKSLDSETENSKNSDSSNTQTERGNPWPSTKTPKQELSASSERSSRDNVTSPSDTRDGSPLRKNLDFSARRQATRTASNQSATKAEKQHSQLHSYGADYSATFQSLSTTAAPSAKPSADGRAPSRSGSLPGPADAPQHMLPPSDRLKGLMLDSLPAHVFVALPVTGEIVWVNNRYLNYRGQTVPELYQNPWGTIHPEEREEYLKGWSHAIRTGDQFSKQVRIRRFDGNYRWFYTRAVGHRDIRGVIVQWYGSHMDIHDQHIAEVKAARQEEIEASEAKHRQLANLIPQIIFAATEDEGVTFANEQWLTYTGQGFEEALGLGFMDFVHPEDLAKCSIPSQQTNAQMSRSTAPQPSREPSNSSSSGRKSSHQSSNFSDTPTNTTIKDVQPTLSRHNSSSTGSFADFQGADLAELARNGVIKVSTDSDGRPSYTTELRLRSKAGEYRWHLVRCVEVNNISLGSGDGSWFGACTDINDHKLLETKLKDAMDSKTRFLSNMSHEIRTPLIGISGMVNFLQDTPLNDEQIDYANTIHASAKSLLNIINDILDLSKVDAGMMKLSHDWFHPRSLVEEVNEMVCTMAITKRLELNYVVDVDVPEMVKGDKFRIRQVLLNVVGNAIKFTTTGEVFSRCKVSTNTLGLLEDEIMLEFSVIDTGRGFTQEEAELIFKPFSQIDGSSTRQHGGSGLGLVISRTLVELHGGSMQGSAVPDKGSTFVFTAKFGLPTTEDHPVVPITPQAKPSSASRSVSMEGILGRPSKPILPSHFMQTSVEGPKADSTASSPAVLSSSSSTPSVRSIHSHATQRSSGSSIAQSLSHFGDAARAVGRDLAQMKLALPEKLASPPANVTTFGRTAPFSPTKSLSVQVDTPSQKSSASSLEIESFRPPMYSILLICPQTHSREATTQHIENTLPKDVPHQITALATVAEARELIAVDDPIRFTHVVLNLGSADEVVAAIVQITTKYISPPPSIVILSDPVERQEVIKLAASHGYEQLAEDNRVTFIYKPVKPSRFAVVFDPDKQRDLSTDRNRFSAQQQVASQKQNYLDVAKRLGNKGYKVLLVEDDPINQKVLLKYLSKIGIAVELALDGVECLDKVFARPHHFYSLILCDLHMPRKDGYQTCREIRHWEEKENLPRTPIIALSANVMADVFDKCLQAGFSNYVTKPVDFRALSAVMGDLLDLPESGRSAPIMG